MTGLDPQRDSILQISCFVTDYQLNILDERGWDATIQHPKSTLDSMNEWCVKTHGSTGLTKAVLASSTTAEQAAAGLLEYIREFAPRPRKALLAGNSVHADKAFLSIEPYNKIIDHLHHRILDVSSIKEAVRRWAPEGALVRIPRKKGLHLAKEDILESIEEARFYRERFFSV